MLYQILAVCRKEFTDMFRDGRTLMAAFSFSIIGPVLLGFFIHMSTKEESQQDRATLYVAGVSYAPGLIQHFKNTDMNLEILPYESGMENNPEKANDYFQKDNSLLMVITPDYQEKLDSYQLVKFHIFGDMSKQENTRLSRKVRSLIKQYEVELVQVRLLGRGIAPSMTKVFSIDVADLSQGGLQSRMIAGLFIIYFIMAPFIASMSIAIDVTAGERERQSLQVLQAQPISSYNLLLGKWLVVATFGLIGTFLTTALGFVVLIYSPLGEIGVQFELNVYTIIKIVLALLPLVFLVAILQMLVAMFAKTFKEAQTYMSFVSFLPAILLTIKSMKNLSTDSIFYYAPLIAESEVISGILRQSDWQLSTWGISVLITALLSGGFYLLTARLLDSERLLSES